jgi:hypothetical protein
MSARQIERTLSELHARHGTKASALTAVPLAPAVDWPVTLVGMASTTDVDLDRVRYGPFAFGHKLPSNLPLHYDHEGESVGSVDVWYDEQGQLCARATTFHKAASRCNAFSVSARPREVNVRSPNNPGFYVEIVRAELVELSLVPVPVNPNALVTQRTRPPPSVEFYILTQRKLQIIQQMLPALLQQKEATP